MSGFILHSTGSPTIHKIIKSLYDEKPSLGFIGGVRITKMILQAIANSKTENKTVLVYDTNPAVLSAFKARFPDILLADTAIEAVTQEIVFITLHPPVIMETLELVKDSVKAASIVISLEPKTRI